VFLTPREVTSLGTRPCRGTADGVQFFGGDGVVCIFLSTRGLCSVEQAKPARCRYYPFHVDPRNGAVLVDLSCPGVGKGDPVSLEAIGQSHQEYFQELGLSADLLGEVGGVLYDGVSGASGS